MSNHGLKIWMLGVRAMLGMGKIARGGLVVVRARGDGIWGSGGVSGRRSRRAWRRGRLVRCEGLEGGREAGKWAKNGT